MLDLWGAREEIGAEAFLLRGLALPCAGNVLAALEQIRAVSPFRRMVTPGGFTMSVEMTNCGELGWTTDRRGYRYTAIDPLTDKPWPTMPEAFLELARESAATVGFEDFTPDACLINRYVPGARLSLHQDKDEADFSQPVVSVSYGMTATFLFGGNARTDPAARMPLEHGDVVVWGGEDRLRYHGVNPLKKASHPELGEQRINLTFRKAG